MCSEVFLTAVEVAAVVVEVAAVVVDVAAAALKTSVHVAVAVGKAFPVPNPHATCVLFPRASVVHVLLSVDGGTPSSQIHTPRFCFTNITL